jgi:nucleotide-binding universal stress UspA family protein
VTVDISKILYPTDMSKHSVPALSFAADIAGRYNAELHCVHILDLEHELFLEEEYLAYSGTKKLLPSERIVAAAEQNLDSFLKHNLASSQNRIIKRVISGKPFVEIIHYARAQKIDLIVLGTHGRSAMPSAFLGSVAEKVVRKAPCPVLIVRHPEHRFQAP